TLPLSTMSRAHNRRSGRLRCPLPSRAWLAGGRPAMPRRSGAAVLALLIPAIVMLRPPAATASVGPPWCGDPVPDAAGNLPDGSGGADPVGSFPHIPYSALRCTLEGIA